MLTLKQVEALYWIVRLGSFERAAARLNTTQSAVSKRIQELEAVLSVELFDRRQRNSRLTAKGMEFLIHAEELMRVRDELLQSARDPEIAVKRFRLGVTELTAMTWLAKLITEIRNSYPNIMLEPDVDNTVALHKKLEAGELDLIVVPDVYRHPRLTSVILDEIEIAWMCSSELVPSTQAIPLADIERYTVLSQGDLSGSGIIVNRWLREHGVSVRQSVTSNSLMAMAGVTMAGMGVSYLPRLCFQGAVDQGLLHIIRTQPGLPKVPYSAIYKSEDEGGFHALVVRLCHLACNYSHPFLFDTPR